MIFRNKEDDETPLLKIGHQVSAELYNNTAEENFET